MAVEPMRAAGNLRKPGEGTAFRSALSRDQLVFLKLRWILIRTSGLSGAAFKPTGRLGRLACEFG